MTLETINKVENVIGKYGRPAGQKEYWKIVKMRQTPSMVVVEFENNFVCNIEVVKIKES